MKNIGGNEKMSVKLTGAFGKAWYAAGAALFVIVFIAGCTASPAQNKSSSVFYANRSIAAYNRDNYKVGIRQGNAAVKFGPSNSRSWYWLGENYKANKQPDEAIKAFKKVISLDNEKNYVRKSAYNLGFIYEVKGDYKQAIYYYSKRLGMEKSGHFTYGYSYMNRSEMYLYAGMYDEALQDASNAMKYAVKHFNVDFRPRARAALYKWRAFSYLGLGDTKRALGMITKAQQVSPKFNAKHFLSLIYFATGNESKLKVLVGEKGWLGIEMKNYAKGSVKAIQVASVLNATSAEKGGLLTGDLIVRMNGKPAQDASKFSDKISASAPGSIIYLEIIRGTEEKKIDIRLGSRIETSAMKTNKLIAPFLAKQKMFAPAKEAEKSGHYRKAFQLYQKAPRRDSDITGRIISLYHKLDPAPVISEEARKHAVFAATATRVAKDNHGYDQAIKEAYSVMRSAPWWADPYINLALLLEKRGRFVEAHVALGLYLLASPNAADANTVKTKLYELEYQAKNTKPAE